jgi:hypothetical protein
MLKTYFEYVINIISKQRKALHPAAQGTAPSSARRCTQQRKALHPKTFAEQRKALHPKTFANCLAQAAFPSAHIPRTSVSHVPHCPHSSVNGATVASGVALGAGIAGEAPKFKQKLQPIPPHLKH